jgi:hypothetical protein
VLAILSSYYRTNIFVDKLLMTESAILMEETFHRTLAFMGPVIVVMLLEWICANHLRGYLNAAFLGRCIHGIFHGSHYVYPSQAQWYVPFASILDFRCKDKNTIPGFAQMYWIGKLDTYILAEFSLSFWDTCFITVSSIL